MSCITKLTQNITYDCSSANRAKAGLETRAVIINLSDVDRTATTTSGGTVTNLTLLSGATANNITWIKQLSSTASEFSPNDSGVDTFIHTFNGRVFGQSAEDNEAVKQLSEGEFLVVVETKFKGTNNKDAFKIFGFQNGLKMAEGSQTSLENDGSFVFSLKSQEGFGEDYKEYLYLETDYATTKAKFDALFA